MIVGRSFEVVPISEEHIVAHANLPPSNWWEGRRCDWQLISCYLPSIHGALISSPSPILLPMVNCSYCFKCWLHQSLSVNVGASISFRIYCSNYMSINLYELYFFQILIPNEICDGIFWTAGYHFIFEICPIRQLFSESNLKWTSLQIYQQMSTYLSENQGYIGPIQMYNRKSSLVWHQGYIDIVPSLTPFMGWKVCRIEAS